MGKRKHKDIIDLCHMKVDNITLPISPFTTPTNIKKQRKQTIPKALKIAVWKTHIGMEIGTTLCSVCKTNQISQMDFQCGHIKAESEGGETCLSNLIPVCSKCNQSMGTKNLNSFRDTYFK
jgi:hypothetical protein